MTTSDVFAPSLEQIKDPAHLDRMIQLITWIDSNYPTLGKRIAWQQPLYTDHETFILGLKPSKKHLSVNPENSGIEHFAAAIDAAGYERQTMTFSIPWTSEVNFPLLKEIIDWQIEDKKNTSTFWRK